MSKIIKAEWVCNREMKAIRRSGREEWWAGDKKGQQSHLRELLSFLDLYLCESYTYNHDDEYTSVTALLIFEI